MAKGKMLPASKEIRRNRAKKALKTTFSSVNKFDYIKKPIITEKSMADVEKKVYTFEVDKNATKRDIKVLIEEIYDVKVESVRTSNTKRKPKTVGRHSGYRSGYKKAAVKLSNDSKELESFNL